MRFFERAFLLACPLSFLFATEVKAIQPCPPAGARCTDDWLMVTDQAERRLRWARNCALRNTSTSPPFDTYAPASNGGTLHDYNEYDPNVTMTNFKSYLGLHFNINGIFVEQLYKYGPTSQSMVGGYYQWERDPSLKYTKPFYPTYGTDPDASKGDTLYPNDSDPTDCHLYTTTAHTVAVANFYLGCYCQTGCYTPDQKVLYSSGYQEIGAAMDAGKKDVVTLRADASLDNLRMQTNVVGAYITDLREADHQIYDINTDSGGHLSVTEEHPLILSNGRVVAAHMLRVNDQLVNREGAPDRILSISTRTFFGRVYNLRPVTSDRRSNILVAQDYLNGSLLYQTEYLQYLNRVILSRSIPEALVPK